MQFKKITYWGGVWVILAAIFFFFLVVDVRAQYIPGEYMEYIVTTGGHTFPPGISNNWIVPTALGTCGNSCGYYFQYFGPTRVLGCTLTNCNSWFCGDPPYCSIVKYKDCFVTSCTGGFENWQDYIYGVTSYTIAAYGGDRDYDCDGIPDSADQHPSDPSDRRKGAGRSLNFICPVGTDPTNISVGNPTNVATGNKYEEVLDLSVSTPGIPLEFRRSYNSQVLSDGPLGFGWTHSFDVSLGVVQNSPTKRVRIWDSDGRGLCFSEVQQTSTEILFGGESGVKDRLKQVISSGEYYLHRKEENLTYRFNSDGKLLEISDPNGNTLALTYTGGLLAQVSDNFGKSISIQYNVGNRISSITDPKGQSILYEYTNGDLTKVTYPDQNFVRYAYSNHYMTDKYDTSNNLIGHWDYDSYGRVITYYSHLKDRIQSDMSDMRYGDMGSGL